MPEVLRPSQLRRLTPAGHAWPATRVRTGRPGKTKFKNIVLKGIKKTGAKVTVRGWDPARTTNLTITRTGKVK